MKKPLNFTWIRGYVGRYAITKNGVIWSSSKFKKKNRITKIYKCPKGYWTVSLRNSNGKKTYTGVHRLLMLTFRYEKGCRKLQVNHKDCDKSNNDLDNLEWCTAKENINHAIENKRRPKGIKNCVPSKPVIQKTREGKIVAKFPSINQAGVSTGICTTTISKVLIKDKGTAGGYIWKYQKNLNKYERIQILERRRRRIHNKVQMD